MLFECTSSSKLTFFCLFLVVVVVVETASLSANMRSGVRIFLREVQAGCVLNLDE